MIDSRIETLTAPTSPLLARQRRIAVSPGCAAVSRQADAFADGLRPVVERMQDEGHGSFWALARALNLAGIAPARAREWHASSVRNLLFRLNRLYPARDYLAQVRTRTSRRSVSGRRGNQQSMAFKVETQTSS